jgi:ribonucleoside-diphosphate reductase alpha chain
MALGPTLPVSVETYGMKYLGEGETFEQGMHRIANALKDDQPHYKKMRDILMHQRFLPAGRVQSAMGAPKAVTPYNCFVSGTIEDTFTDGQNSIMAIATEAAQTMRLGGGIGYDFSTLRPRGDVIKKLGSQSSGPISFMKIYDAVCKCVASSGHRRGAQMGVLRVDHPDIFEFVKAKQNTSELTGFNISVGITDEFMECLGAGKPFPLRFGGKIYREIDPRELWEAIMLTTWDWAEPGVLFLDTINRMNNLWYCETIVATNPCGEQPLPPYGACLLGSFNLVKYLRKKAGNYWFDYEQLKEDLPPVVRGMDNVVDRAEYPLPQQGREARSKRRMGLGVTGLANAIEACGHPYGTPQFVGMEHEILATIRDHAYQASVQLAREKGAFAMLDKARYCDSGFMKTVDEDVVRDVMRYGIRNSHLTSIAPTGTISLCADNVSSGIEPVFAHSFERKIETFDGPKIEEVKDYGLNKLGVKGRKSSEVSVKEHLAVLITAAQCVDSAVSKTLNVGDDVDFTEFKSIYTDAFFGGAKGCTTFRASGKRTGILVEKPVEEGAACTYDPETGTRSCE